MSNPDFRYLNKSHCRGRQYIAPGSDKPCELHNVFNAMVASTKKRTPIMTEQNPTVKAETEKKRANWRGKTAEQHLAEAKAMTLFGVKVLDETPRKVGGFWQVLIECERCGNQKWANKGDLTRTKSCGCLYAERSKKNQVKPEKKLAFGLDAPIVDLRHDSKVVETVEEIVENEQKEVMTVEEKTTLMNILEAKQSSQRDEQNDQQRDEKADRVCVSRRLVDRLARDCSNKLQNFWLLHPVEFNALMRDAKELYEALQ